MLIKLYEENPDERKIRQIVDILKNGGIIIYPTDTVYSLGCSINHHKAVERIARIKGVKVENSKFSFIFYDLSHISDFTRPFSNQTFKMLKRNIPGPFSFILNANANIPSYFKGKKKTVGIRVPNNEIIRTLVKELGSPIFSTSIHDQDEIIEYTTDPELIEEEYKNVVDLVIDGGFSGNEVSTIVDCTTDNIEILREGKGVLI